MNSKNGTSFHWTLLLFAGLAFSLAILMIAGCGASPQYTTTPVVTEQVLGTSDGVTVNANGEMVFERTVQCPSDGDCEVEMVMPITDRTTIQTPQPKRSCMGAMALGGLAGTAGGAAYGSIRYPNDVAVSPDRVDVLFDATWKFAAVGGAASALVTGVICYATR